MNLPAEVRFNGCLAGSCLADAVALSVADLPGEMCREFSTKELQTWHSDCDNILPASPLQYSEGAQLSVAMMSSFVKCRGFDPSDFAERLKYMCRNKQIVRRTWETYQASKNLSQGVAWTESGIDLPGAGPARRAAPVGLFFFFDYHQRQQATANQTQITNKNAKAMAGATVVAETVAMLIGGENVRPEVLLESVARPIQTMDKDFFEQLHRLPALLKLPPEHAAAQICSTVPADPFTNAPGGIPSHVLPVVLWSLYAFLRSPDDFTQALALSLYPGGDVVSTSSIVGAFSGSFLGLDGLPSSLCRRLVNGHLEALSEITKLTRAAHEIVMSLVPGTV